MVRSLWKSLLTAAVLLLLASPASAAFHLWNISEIYSNGSGTLQFIEFQTNFGSQQFVAGQQISVTNLGGTATNTFTLPVNLPGDSTNKRFLIGTAGIQALGSPAPDYIMPNNFLFAAGGSISFFGANSGAYTALPTDGSLSRTWTGGNALNSPTNFAGQTGTIVIPEPSLMVAGFLLTSFGAWVHRRKTPAPTL